MRGSRSGLIGGVVSWRFGLPSLWGLRVFVVPWLVRLSAARPWSTSRLVLLRGVTRSPRAAGWWICSGSCCDRQWSGARRCVHLPVSPVVPLPLGDLAVPWPDLIGTVVTSSGRASVRLVFLCRLFRLLGVGIGNLAVVSGLVFLFFLAFGPIGRSSLIALVDCVRRWRRRVCPWAGSATADWSVLVAEIGSRSAMDWTRFAECRSGRVSGCFPASSCPAWRTSCRCPNPAFDRTDRRLVCRKIDRPTPRWLPHPAGRACCRFLVSSLLAAFGSPFWFVEFPCSVARFPARVILRLRVAGLVRSRTCLPCPLSLLVCGRLRRLLAVLSRRSARFSDRRPAFDQPGCCRPAGCFRPCSCPRSGCHSARRPAGFSDRAGLLIGLVVAALRVVSVLVHAVGLVAILSAGLLVLLIAAF